MMLLGIVTLLIGGSIAPAASPTCDAKGLTRECAIFKNRGLDKNVYLPDGTYIKLPVPKRSQSDFEPDELGSQVKLMRALTKIPKPHKPTDAFIVAIIRATKRSGVKGFLSGKSNARLSPSLVLPWPPGEENGKESPVTAEMWKQFYDSIPAENRNELSSNFDSEPPQALKDEEPMAPRLDMSKRGKRVEELFKFAREALLDEILAERNYGQLSNAEKSQYDRIKHLTIASPEQAANEPSCSKLAPEAFYTWEGHRVVICPGMYHLPDSALVEVLGHEVAHPIDPCTLQLPLIEIDRKKFNEAKASSSSSSNPEAQILLDSLSHSGNESLAIYSGVLSSRRKDAVSFLTSSQIAKVVAPGIPLKLHPSMKAYSCLVNEVGIREVTPKDLSRIADAYIRDRRGVWIDDNSSKFRSSVLAMLSQYPQCVAPSSGRSQISEAMSDAWSSKILGRWLLKNPPRNDIERLAPMAMFLPAYCRSPAASGKANPKVAVSSKILDIGVDALAQVHPYGRERAEKIFLAEKSIQTALSCTPIKRASCSAYLGKKTSTHMLLEPDVSDDQKARQTGAQ